MENQDVIRPRSMGFMNGRGLWTLTSREISRFLRIFPETLIAPVCMTVLMYLVFNVSMGAQGRSMGDVPFSLFLISGLTVMGITQNAFMNSAASLMIMKIEGNIVDLLMAPLSSLELTLGYVFAGLVRGGLVAILTLLVMAFFVPLHVVHADYLLFHCVAGSLFMALMGMATGIWSEKFEHMAAVQNFIITPMTFLSGAFFSPADLPESWRPFLFANPFFYLTDGFRYGLTGHADGSLSIGLWVMGSVNVVLFWGVCRLLKSGYKLKT